MKALILAICGGGLGWLLILAGYSTWQGSLPLEFYSPETFGFLSLYGLPHLVLARALLLWGFCYYLSGNFPALPSKSLFSLGDVTGFNPGIYAGLLWLILGFVQPLTVVIAWAVVFTHLCITAIWEVWRKRRGLDIAPVSWSTFTGRGFWAVALSSPMVLYTFITFRVDPFLRYWTAQNIISSPHPFHYLLAYGLLIPFIMFGGYHLVRRNAGNGWFIVGWVLLLPFLAYAPYNLQRRLPEGIWVAFVVLGLVGIYTLQSKFLDIKSRLLRFLLTKADSIAVGLLLPSTIILLIGGILSVLKPREPLFIPSEQAAAFDFLSMNAFPGEIVLASYPTSNALPAWAPIRVVAGHGPETIDLAELIPQVTRIFQSRTSDAERIHFLTTQAVGYIIWGPEERSLGDWNPERAVYLQRIYQSEHYSVYQVDLTGF